MNDPVCHRELRRYWFPADRGFGVGVTATSEVEARGNSPRALPLASCRQVRAWVPLSQIST
jgi:hypothetical protein